MIKIHDLWRIYEQGSSPVSALAGIDLEVAPGEFLAIVGPSGSGKSTLLNLLGALDTATKGDIEVAGQDLRRLNDADRTRFRRTCVGFAFQFFNLLPMLSARENVLLPLLLAGVSKNESERRADVLLARVGLLDRAHHSPEALSGGEMQRIAVARALVTDPPLILADEPTGNLDSVAGAEVLSLLQETLDGGKRSLVMVTHDKQIASIADRTITLRDGKICDKSLSKTERPPAPDGGGQK